MPAMDSCHEQVVHALEKDGWWVGTIPYVLPIAYRSSLFIDIHATNNQGATIVVEVKCFPDTRSTITEMYHTLGQYLVYRYFLEMKNVQERLFLTVPLNRFEDTFEPILPLIQQLQIQYLVVDLDNEVIARWSQ